MDTGGLVGWWAVASAVLWHQTLCNCQLMPTFTCKICPTCHLRPMLEVSMLLRSGVRVGVASAGWCFSQNDFSSAFGLTVSVTTSPAQAQQGRPLEHDHDHKASGTGCMQQESP